jgi:spermidine synthase
MLSFCGQTGFVLGRKGYSYSCQHPVRLPSEKLSSQLKWYNPAIHTAAFQLPEFDKASHVGNRGEQGDGCVVGGCNIL